MEYRDVIVMNDKVENIVSGLVRGYRRLQRKRYITKK